MSTVFDTFATAPHDAQGRPLDVIELRQLAVRCIVGVYPAERGTPQPLELDVALYLDTRKAAAGRLRDTVDYARLSGELRFLLETADFRILETAAEALCRYILAPPTADTARAPVRAVTLRLSKPEALGRVGRATLQVHRTADEYQFEVEEKPFGRVDILFQDEHVGIYRLRVAPGRTIPTHEHRVMDEAELVLGHGLLLQGQPVPAGTGIRWPKHFPHRYDNPRATEQTVLCVDRPAFLSNDEVEVPEPPGGLEPVEGRAYYPAAASAPEAEGERW
ncbi:dihydroneopterin aldolase [Vitiosangium sp. GDMCC 1.1324]|uniref:dihydroneopterin aldolase n=1 Tax=Vitiosangium sp. (strain GDMCC 1.1324) TaxID=2138576 RepID=UPI000D38A4D8|nr:dihydroneopterin aldolase [Vitiosangium sp. GDMCC 1.1324]PTL85862.1 dihydroneopterin aldolase [Vitiosangium sp. GDMCC 1.1324]